MQLRSDRRQFLAGMAAISAGYWSESPSIRAAEAPSERLNLAIIGVGGRGAANLDGVKGQNIVALVDVDEKTGGKSFEKFPNVERFQDFRRMFDKLENRLDGVVISTPDQVEDYQIRLAHRRNVLRR